MDFSLTLNPCHVRLVWFGELGWVVVCLGFCPFDGMPQSNCVGEAA